MANLEQISGADAGKEITLAGEKTVLGRHPNCDIAVDASAVSRYHAQIIRRGNDFFVEDLGSRNGTFVNERLVTGSTRLDHLDNVRICDVVYRFVDGSLGATGPNKIPGISTASVVFADDDASTAPSSIMSKYDMQTAGTEHISADADVKLQAILEISNSLGRKLALNEVLPPVLESLFKVFPQAERGFVILRSPANNLEIPYSHFRHEDAQSINISRTIVFEAMDSRQALLSADAANDSRFSLTDSIAQVKIRSFMCVPLINSDSVVLGVVQIDTLDAFRRFVDKDLEILAALAPLIGKAIQTSQLHEVALLQRALQRDLELAQQVQMALLPQERPLVNGWDFFDHYRAANVIGGDYYGYIPLPDNRLAVIVADVSGHGIAAALLMTKLSAEAKFCLASHDEPATVIARLNNLLCEDAVEDRFVTMVLLVLSPDSGTIQLANAGHLSPVLRSADGKTQDVADYATGLPLGVMEGFEYESASFDVDIGENVTLVTDGITEATNPQDDMFGLDRMRASCQRTPENLEEFGTLIVQDVQQFAKFATQGDDICVVCLQRK